MPTAPPKHTARSDRPTLHLLLPTPDTTPTATPRPSPPRINNKNQQQQHATTDELPYDQYGFRRTDTHTSLADQTLLDAHHRLLADARALKWDDWISRHNNTNNNGDPLLLLPPRGSDKAKRYVRKGVPHHLRKRVWFAYSGGERLALDGAGMYGWLICREERDVALGYGKIDNEVIGHVSVIDRDIYRTFPDHLNFQPRQSGPSPQFARPDSCFSGSSASVSSSATAASVPRFLPESCDISESPIGDADDGSDADGRSFANSDSTPPRVHARAPTGQKRNHQQPSIHNEQNPYLLSLRRILVAFAYYSWPHPNPDENNAPFRRSKYPIGYCQSLNFIVGFLLLVYANDDFAFECGDEDARLAVEERVFWTLVAVVEELLPVEMFGATLEGARVSQVVLWDKLVRKDGASHGLRRLQEWLEKQEMEGAAAGPARPVLATSASSSSLSKTLFARYRRRPKAGTVDATSSSAASLSTTGAQQQLSLITTQWFLTTFITVLPTPSLLLLWDSFVMQGVKVLYRFTLTLLAMHQRQITALSLADLSAWKLLKTLPHRCYDVAACVEMFRGKTPPLGAPAGAGSQDGGGGTWFAGRGRFRKEERMVASPVSPADDHESQWDNHAAAAAAAGLRKGVGTVDRKLLEKYSEQAMKELRSPRSVD